MAITRCPYCRAIIDEKDKFCTNCGTQLLYAEDAEVEEDIPGEKITHADVEEKDYTIPEPEGEETGDVIIRDEEPEGTTFLEGEERETKAETAAGAGEEPEEGQDKEAEAESAQVEEPAETKGKGKEFRELASVLLAEGEKEEKEGPGEEAVQKVEPEEVQPKPVKREPRAERPRGSRQKAAGLPPAEEPAAHEPFLFSPRPQDAEPVKKSEAPAKKAAALPADDHEEREEQEPEVRVPAQVEGEAAPQPPSTRKDMTFDTEELNRIGPTVDLAHRQVEEFLKVLKEEEEGAAARPAVPPPPETKDTRSLDTGLPPWVKEMRKASADERADVLGRKEEKEEEEEEEEEEELRAEEESEAERVFAAAQSQEESGEFETATPDGLKRTDSGVGLPEKTQARLPFGTPATAEAIEGEPPAARQPYEFEDERAVARPAPRPPFHLGSFLKAKAFDVLFLAAIWLVCLWLAAGRLNGTLFELFDVASDALFAFGGILLVLYFFLFYFFLGETLGDRLFREWEEEEAED
jgi:hypothetical protein